MGDVSVSARTRSGLDTGSIEHEYRQTEFNGAAERDTQDF